MQEVDTAQAAQPTNPSEAYSKWCGSCNAHCCHDIAIQLLLREFEYISASTKCILYPVDSYPEFLMCIESQQELEEGFHYFQRGRYLYGRLIGRCGNLIENGLCGRDEDGLPKPTACISYEAGGDSCLKLRLINNINS